MVIFSQKKKMKKMIGNYFTLDFGFFWMKFVLSAPLLAYCHAMLHFLAAPCSQEAGHLWQEQEEEEEEE